MSFGLSEGTLAALCDAELPAAYIADLVRRTLAEDLLGANGIDVTSVATIEATQHDAAIIVARATGVVAGLPLAAAVFDVAAGGELAWSQHVSDGTGVTTGDVLATVTGPTRQLLGAERSALNLLCRASGIATHTRAWVDAVSGHPVMILDTRKTTPGLRAVEKYAVRCGGGHNKRMGLFDVAMIKDNHKRAAGSIAAAFQAVSAATTLPIEVEVTSVAEAVEAVTAGARFLLCDNMSPQLLREVVHAVGGVAELEATGGLRLDSAAEYAATGVNYLSVGALTHSSPILDIALDLTPSRAV